MSPLARLGFDLGKISFKRWIDHGMDRAFRFGERSTGGFDPLVWIRSDRPRLRMSGGFADFVTIMDVQDVDEFNRTADPIPPEWGEHRFSPDGICKVCDRTLTDVHVERHRSCP